VYYNVRVFRPSGCRQHAHLHPRKIILGSRSRSKMADTVFRYRKSAKLIGLPCMAGRFPLWTAVDIHPLRAWNRLRYFAAATATV